jgi:D-lactate dehydrogenase
MTTAVFSTKPYDAKFLVAANASAGHELDFFEEKLSPHTAKLAEGHTAICAFVNDLLNARTLDVLHRQDVRFVALRCAGFNHVDLRYASSLGIKVAHVPAYSPYAVAEFALALVLALNRRIHRAYNRVRDGNFSIDGLLGFDLYGKTVSLERERSGACSQAFLQVLGSTFSAMIPIKTANLLISAASMST